MWDFNIPAFRYHDVPFAIPLKSSTFTVIMSDIPMCNFKNWSIRLPLTEFVFTLHVMWLTFSIYLWLHYLVQMKWVGFPFWDKNCHIKSAALMMMSCDCDVSEGFCKCVCLDDDENISIRGIFVIVVRRLHKIYLLADCVFLLEHVRCSLRITSKR